MADGNGWDEWRDEAPDDDVPPHAEPTPGERVLYALGQLYRIWHAGRLPAPPNKFDIEDIARLAGVWPHLEFVTTDRHGTHYHFGDEVLYVNPEKPFPWRLLSVWEWAAEQELNAFWAEGWD